MAAQRLIALLIVLLVFSTVLAALAPERASQTSSDSTETTDPTRSPPSAGTHLRVEVDQAEPTADPISLSVDDRLTLRVRVSRPGTVTITGPEDYELREFAQPGAPARFDLIFTRAGSYPIELAGDPEPLAIISVGPAERRPVPRSSRRA